MSISLNLQFTLVTSRHTCKAFTYSSYHISNGRMYSSALSTHLNNIHVRVGSLGMSHVP